VMNLPGIEELRKLTQSLAMLDAIMSTEWEYRYYSFNCRWDTDEMMASMRDGSGSHWFLHFSRAGAFLKGFAHESPMASNAPWPGVVDSVPPVFARSTKEPAFMMRDTTFCFWREPEGDRWQQGEIAFPSHPDPDGSQQLLGILNGGPEWYQSFAIAYNEMEIPLAAVVAIYDFQPITNQLVLSLNPEEAFIEDVIVDAKEIGYPVANDQNQASPHNFR
jgi:hypothetical protein